MSSIPSDLNWKVLYSGDPHAGWLHSGIAVMSDGTIVFEAAGGSAFMLMSPLNPTPSTVAVNAAVLHGITAEAGSENFWICDPGVYLGPPAGQVLLVNRHGEVLRKLSRPGLQLDATPPWKPTSLAVVEVDGPHAGDIWIGDGYGESLLHRISPDGGTQTFDGISTGLAFDCPHGVAIDTRWEAPLVAIADRGNQRVVYLTLDGDFAREVKSPLMTSPSSLAVRGERLMVTDLFGAILSIDMNDEIEIHLSAANAERGEGWPNHIEGGVEVAPVVRDCAVNSPHGIAVAPDGRVLFTEWYLGGRVVQIF